MARRQVTGWRAAEADRGAGIPLLAARETLQHTLMRTSRIKGRQQLYDSSVVLVQKRLDGRAATMQVL